jgi:uncharacterized membrane protein YfcA
MLERAAEAFGSPSVLAILLATTFVACALSGVASTGGGFLLMGAMALFLPMREAIPLHALVMAFANLARVVLLHRYVRLELLGRFCLGLLPGALLGVLLWTGGEPKRLRLLLALIVLVTAWWQPKTRGALGSWTVQILGFYMGVAGMFVGATGPLNASILLRADLGQEEFVATNSAWQALSHLVKVVSFSGLGHVAGLDPVRWVPLALVALIATYTGRRLLSNLPLNVFRRLVQLVITGVALALIVQELGGFQPASQA